MSAQEHMLHYISPVEDPCDYIWITKDILKTFKSQTVISNRTNLNFTTIRYKGQTPKSNKRKYPSGFSERIQMLHEKKPTSLDLKENKMSSRPVKVIVEDITKFKYIQNPRDHSNNKTNITMSRSSDVTVKRYQ